MIHHSTDLPVLLSSAPPYTSASRGPSESFWGAILGNNLLHFISPTPHHSLAFIGALAVSHLMSYLPLVLLLPSFKNLIGLSCLMSPPLTLPQCGSLPLFYSLSVILVGIGEGVRVHTHSFCHHYNVRHCNSIKQQVV